MCWIGCFVVLAGCTALTAPATSQGTSSATTSRQLVTDPARPRDDAPDPTQIGAQPGSSNGAAMANEVGAKTPAFKAAHIVFEYVGSARNNPKVERSKQSAKARAIEVMRQAQRPGADFAALARQYSDGESAARGGLIGKRLDAASTDPAIYQALAQLQPGQVSDVVETKWGFHVLQRIE